MFKRTEATPTQKIAVDVTMLQDMLSLGKNSAIEIGRKAGAEIHVGRRTLYNVKKVEAYMDQLTEG